MNANGRILRPKLPLVVDSGDRSYIINIKIQVHS